MIIKIVNEAINLYYLKIQDNDFYVALQASHMRAEKLKKKC